MPKKRLDEMRRRIKDKRYTYIYMYNIFLSRLSRFKILRYYTSHTKSVRSLSIKKKQKKERDKKKQTERKKKKKNLYKVYLYAYEEDGIRIVSESRSGRLFNNWRLFELPSLRGTRSHLHFTRENTVYGPDQSSREPRFAVSHAPAILVYFFNFFLPFFSIFFCQFLKFLLMCILI